MITAVNFPLTLPSVPHLLRKTPASPDSPKEAALKHWKKFGFYFLNPKMNRVLIHPSIEKTYILKILFLHTGTLILQGSPSEVHNAFLRLPLSFRNMPELTLCLSKSLTRTLKDFNKNREQNFTKIIGDIFNFKLKFPDKKKDKKGLLSSYSTIIDIPSTLEYLFKFLDGYIQNIIDRNSPLYSDLLGKGIRSSTVPSIYYLEDMTSSSGSDLISSFLKDYISNLEKNKWQSILASHVYKSFMIWVSKMLDYTASFYPPLRKEFFTEILSHVGVKLSFCNGYEIIHFDIQAFKSFKAFKEQEELSYEKKNRNLEENLENSYYDFKEILHRDGLEKEETLNAQSRFLNSETFSLMQIFDKPSREVPEDIKRSFNHLHRRRTIHNGSLYEGHPYFGNSRNENSEYEDYLKGGG